MLFMFERVRANMHIMLCMNPIGEKFRNRLRQYPSLINCTTIDWFLAWPREALLEVGNKFLMNLSLVTTITGVDKLVRVILCSIIKQKILVIIIMTFKNNNNNNKGIVNWSKSHCYSFITLFPLARSPRGQKPHHQFIHCKNAWSTVLPRPLL